MSVLSPALLGACGLVLVAAAASHLRAPEALRRGLLAQGVLPSGVHGPVSLVLGPVEAALGVAALFVALAGSPSWAALAVGMPIAGLFLLLALYLTQVSRVTAGQVVPCACGLGEAPVGPPAIARAGILAALAVLGGLTASGWSITAAPAPEIFVTVAAMLVLATSAALLPAARAVPEAAIHTTHHGSH